MSGGITNTIYYIKTTKDKFILTIFEELNHKQLPFYIDLTDFLAQHRLPVAPTIQNCDNKKILTIKSKPAVLSVFLPGEVLTEVAPSHCEKIGKQLATMHLTTFKYNKSQENLRGSDWHQTTSKKLYSVLSKQDTILLQAEVEIYENYLLSELPQGIIHADLFRDFYLIKMV